MTDKENNVKLKLELLIANIDEFGQKFVTYKAESKKELLENTLKYIKYKEQECKEYADKVEYIHAFLKNPHNYGSFKPMWGSFLLHWLFNENLGDFFPQEAYEMTDTITEKEKQIINYKQALDEIEKTIIDYPSKGIQEVQQSQIEYIQHLLDVNDTKLRKILGIINNAKEQ